MAMARTLDGEDGIEGPPGDDGFSIPATISPQAQAFLRTAFARSWRDDRHWPEPTDRDAWRAV
ncbi:MAG TPA: hypothetical protein VFU81_12030, partial [Thermomicrobiales bacterium]|nr:hypothetical protein [Thermomicrobiales bacterium]